MSEKNSGRSSNTADRKRPSLATFAYWGAIVGMASALATIFVVTFFHGESMGLAVGECTVLACVSTLLLSQPTGAVGLVIGAACGVIVGVGAGHLHNNSTTV